MRKISEIKGENALDVLAEIIEPAAEIMTDKEFRAYVEGNEKLKAIKQAIKGHKKAVITLLAILNEEDPETYEPNILALPLMMLNLFNDPDLVSLFQSQGQKTSASSGSATENTEETEEA